jgi:predicted nucleic acid-binding protein
MLVIADSSPLIVLVNIGHIGVLPKLFGEVVIPPAVASEIAAPARPEVVREFSLHAPRGSKCRLRLRFNTSLGYIRAKVRP